MGASTEKTFLLASQVASRRSQKTESATRDVQETNYIYAHSKRFVDVGVRNLAEEQKSFDSTSQKSQHLKWSS